MGGWIKKLCEFQCVFITYFITRNYKNADTNLLLASTVETTPSANPYILSTL